MNDDNLIIADPWGQDSWGSSATVGTNSNSYAIANASSAPTQTIQGKMIQVMEEVDLQIIESRDPKEIKMAMVTKIAEEMINSKMIEFTSEKDELGLKVKVRARAFLTPDDQVRLLRKAGY